MDYYTIIRIQEKENLESDYLASLKQKAEEDDDKEIFPQEKKDYLIELN